MNGLKIIRKRCNVTLDELSLTLGVTRQTISSWENNTKIIPDERKKQLSLFFKIDGKYFKELTNDEIQVILSKPVFSNNKNEKESYRFEPSERDEKYSDVPYYFSSDEAPYQLLKNKVQEKTH